MSTMEENYISYLKTFPTLDFQSKQKVIADGRPTPELKGLFPATGQKVPRSFQMDWYRRKEWLCGCAATRRLYCFPCLLFSPCDNVWTNAGYCDIKNLPWSLGKHEWSTAHIQNQITLKTFGASGVNVALSEQRRLGVSVHNAKVKENREVLKDLIDATCFLARQELAFSAGGSPHRGNYVELLQAFAEKDERLARHLETSTVFADLSDRLQNDLIEAVGDVIRNDIKQEVGAASSVAVEVDEAREAQVSLILRYVLLKRDACEVKEAFLGFADMSGDGRAAAAVAAHVLSVLDRYRCVGKLVAQSYDGAAVAASELDAAQAQVKKAAPEAMFYHCYAHKLNLVLMQSARCLPESGTFFQMVEGLGRFFSASAKRTQLLNEVVKRRSPAAAAGRWSTDARWLQTISGCLADLRVVFRVICDNPGGWDNDSLMLALGYDQWLAKTSTCFLIMTYEDVFAETDALQKVLQDKVADVGFCCARIHDAFAAIEGMRRGFHAFYLRYEQRCASLGLTEAGSRASIWQERRQSFSNILSNVGLQMRARFQHFAQLAFLDLLDCSKFHKMSKHFDDTKLQSLSEYARFFDLARLKAELIGLYGSKPVRSPCKSPQQLLSFLAQNDLIQTVPEAAKLLQLALTLPVAAASAETPALKRLKTYGRSRTEAGRGSSLALISFEAERLLRLKEQREEFYSQVTELFVEKDQRTDFIYK